MSKLKVYVYATGDTECEMLELGPRPVAGMIAERAHLVGAYRAITARAERHWRF